MLGWGGGDVNVPCTCTHVACYARCWVGLGVGGMLTFLALAHMLHATQDAGLGLHLRTCWKLRKMLGWGGGDVNVPCTCTHVGCYARCFSLHELLQRMVAKSLLERKWSTKCGAILMISCPSPSIISPKQPDWSMIRSGSICAVGNRDKMRARTCGPTCKKCLLSEKKDAADSLLKFKRALNAGATLFCVLILLDHWICNIECVNP